MKPGFYFRLYPPDLQNVEGQTLSNPEQYRRVPTLLMLAIAPVFGGLFVLLFPLLVTLTVVATLTMFAVKKLRNVPTTIAKYFQATSYQPAASYLTNKSEPGEVPPELKDLEQEVNARRAEEASEGD